MKLLIYCVLALAALSFSCSGRKVVLGENEIPEDVFYLPDEIKPYTGKCLVYYANTEKIKDEMCFKKGLLHGKWISYYKNGSVKCTGYYEHGNLDGKWKGYDENGKMIYEVEYTNDTLTGQYFSWYPTGVIKEKGTYAKNQKTGEWVSFDEAGMIIRKSSL
jgi:antitoxin component YwqK of YwqJK toxin-antitoxin module